jgi:hypothetical protein
MNVEIGTEAVQFPEKEYINGIFVAVIIRTTNHPLFSFLEVMELEEKKDESTEKTQETKAAKIKAKKEKKEKVRGETCCEIL